MKEKIIVPNHTVVAEVGSSALLSAAQAVVALPRLSQATLSTVPSWLSTPVYDRSAVKAGIVHLGTGNFALAHIASYIEEILKDDPRWGIVASSLRTKTMINSLKEQDGLYVLVEREKDNRNHAVMGPIVEAIFGPEDPLRLSERIGDPDTHLVTITVSNKGYCVLPHGFLNWRDADITADLANPDQPRSIYGYMANGLSLRKQRGLPLTVMSLDNIPENSRLLQKALLEFLTHARGADLAAWVKENVDFPVTLVDRITPAATSLIAKEASAQLGVESKVVVTTETFRELVVERSRFTMPDFERVGVKVVDDASPHWRRKFYMVNAGHQVPAIAGQRLGLKYIHEAMAQPVIARMLQRAHKEWGTILDGNPDELKAYGAAVRRRFLDHSLGDTIERVAARATSKVSERLLSSVELSYLRHGELLRVPVFITAVWLHNLGRKDEAGRTLLFHDDDASRLQHLHVKVMQWASQAHLRRLRDSYPAVRGFLEQLSEILLEPRFRRFASDDEFVRELAWCLIKINRKGIKMAARALLRKRQALPRKAITHVLFDCDGVLVKSEHLAFTACCTLVNEVLRQHGVEKQFTVAELMHEFVGCNFRRMIVELSKRHRFVVPDDELERLVTLEEDRVIEKLVKEVQLCTGVNRLLAALHGNFGLAVVSSSALRRVRACLVKAGQDGYFPRANVYSAANSLPVPKSKPQPDIYLHAVADLQTTPDRCVAIEDSVSGVRSAVQAGICVIGYVGAYPVAERKMMAQKLRDAGAFRVVTRHHPDVNRLIERIARKGRAMVD